MLNNRVIQKTAEATGDLICNEIADKITKASRTSPQNISVTVTNEKQIIGLGNTRNTKSLNLFIEHSIEH